MAREAKVCITPDQMKEKVDLAIAKYQSGGKQLNNLSHLIHYMIIIHNETCVPGQELAWMTEFQASYPDH